jgi:hypothetical protein
VSSGKSNSSRHNLATIAWTCAFLWSAVVLANVPARTALASHQAQFGFEPIAYAVTGLAVDTVDFLLLFVTLNLLVALAARLLLRRWFPSFVAALGRTIVPTTVLLVLGDMLGSVWAAEHQIERGLYPTMFEFAHATDASFALAGAQVFALSRFAYATVLSLGLLALAAFGISRRLRMDKPAGWRLAVGCVAGAALISLACFGWHRASPLLIPTIPNWRTIESPLQVFVSFGMDRENVRLGSLSLFQQLDLPSSHLDPGAESLGLPTHSIDRFRLDGTYDAKQCHPHPLATPIGPPGKEAKGSVAYHTELHLVIDELSRALFDGREGPVRVWLLSLESLRGDDIHALHARAPRDVAPFTSSLYERARGGATNVIVAERMLQAGGRTSQGLAAMTCGLGTMPYGLSASRDLGLLPLRCLPDVLKDAMFRTGFYYGSNPGFDNMLAFLNYHGFDRIKAEKDYEEEIPHKGWSVPDWIVFAQAFAESEKEPPDQSQFNFVMSLTNHFPFKKPEDFPAEVGARVAKAVKGREVRPDDVSRLETLSYTDWAAEKLVSAIGGADVARHSMVVMTADHSTTDYFLWREGAAPEDRTLALTHVPFAILFPEPFLDASPSPQGARELVSRLNELLANTVLSQNDLPRFVLGLLMHSAQIRSLPESWRWHTLGGQRLSPNFRVPDHPDAILLGVDGTSRLYMASTGGALISTEEKAVPTLDLATALHSGPTLLPAAAVFSSLLRSYGKSCWPGSTIRHRP